MEMKTITITQPYPALILQGKKKIETRSWPTNYRGPILIHTSVKRIPKEYRDNEKLMSLVEDKENLLYGYIICQAELVDCVRMTEEFIESVKANESEYISGFYSVGRYAWILDNIKPIEPIKAKGTLRLWNFDINQSHIQRGE